MRSITLYGDEVLHQPCEPVTSFDDELAGLIEEMFASMYAARGVGLAANQIGVPLRLFVYDCPDGTGERQVGHLVNPVLQPASPFSGVDTAKEGCLSVPGPSAPLARPGVATATGVDRTGVPLMVSGTGLLARCLQHEIDHLNGIVYVDHLGERERREVLAAATPAFTPR